MKQENVSGEAKYFYDMKQGSSFKDRNCTISGVHKSSDRYGYDCEERGAQFNAAAMSEVESTKNVTTGLTTTECELAVLTGTGGRRQLSESTFRNQTTTSGSKPNPNLSGKPNIGSKSNFSDKFNSSSKPNSGNYSVKNSASGYQNLAGASRRAGRKADEETVQRGAEVVAQNFKQPHKNNVAEAKHAAAPLESALESAVVVEELSEKIAKASLSQLMEHKEWVAELMGAGNGRQWCGGHPPHPHSRPVAATIKKRRELTEGLTARQAFLKAFHAFQKIYIPPRREHSYINEAGVEVRYVTLDALLNHIRPYLVTVGLSVHWEDIYLKQGAVHVTCIAAHHLGGERMCRLALPLSTQEHKMSLAHSMAGTVTLAKRYALMALLGLSTEEADVPAKASPAEADVHHYAKPKPASVIVLRDSVQRPPIWNNEDKKREYGGVDYKKIVALYQSKLQKLRSLGVLGDQAAKPFTAFADFIEAGEPSFEDIVKYGRRLSEVLRQNEASLKADLPVLVRGRRSPTMAHGNHSSVLVRGRRSLNSPTTTTNHSFNGACKRSVK